VASVNRRRFIHALATAALGHVVIAHGQPAGKNRRIGWLYQGSAEGAALNIDTFRAGLRELGYTEGRDYVLEARFASGHTNRLPGLAAELAAIPVEVIVANSTPAALAAMQTSRTIPIVTVAVADPVASGLVRTLSRPGGNVTGTAWALDEVSRKWLELLGSARGGLSRVGALHNSTNASMKAMLDPLEAAARSLGLTLKVHDLTQPDALAEVFNAMAADRIEGLVVLPDALLFDHRQRIAEHTARMRLPAIYGGRRYVEAGGLMSYGPDSLESPHRAASYVDKILRGAKAAELPVERSRKFELIINMKTAKALGLNISPSLLLQAQQILE
jgi:putative ABC transport system substrate-binding protein